MNPLLPAAELRRLAALHDQGFSERWIARRFDLSAPTIRQRLRQIRHETASALPLPTLPPGDPPLPEGDAPPGYDSTNVRRCRGCGALVYLWPCLACCLSESYVAAAPSSSFQP